MTSPTPDDVLLASPISLRIGQVEVEIRAFNLKRIKSLGPLIGRISRQIVAQAPETDMSNVGQVVEQILIHCSDVLPEVITECCQGQVSQDEVEEHVSPRLAAEIIYYTLEVNDLPFIARMVAKTKGLMGRIREAGTLIPVVTGPASTTS